MAKSMTGFGEAHHKSEKMEISVSVKSVNGRFLEVKLRSPWLYNSIETDIRKIISEDIARGSLDVTIHRKYNTDETAPEVRPNLGLAKSWFEAASRVAHHLKIEKNHPSLEAVLRVPEVLEIAEQRELPAWEKKAVLDCVRGAVEKHIESRAKEGQALADAIEDLLSGLERILKKVTHERVRIEKELRQKLEEKLKKLAADVNIAPERVSQELVFLLEKADVEEELIRAKTHVDGYRQTLNEKGSIGKKLEFYTQELHREFNTLGSKTQSVDITRDVIEAKTLIEKLREQVSNIE